MLIAFDSCMTPEPFAAPEALETRTSSSSSTVRGRLHAALARLVADEAGNAVLFEYLLAVAIGGVMVAEFMFSSVTPGVVDEWKCRRAYIYDGECVRADAAAAARVTTSQHLATETAPVANAQPTPNGGRLWSTTQATGSADGRGQYPDPPVSPTSSEVAFERGHVQNADFDGIVDWFKDLFWGPHPSQDPEWQRRVQADAAATAAFRAVLAEWVERELPPDKVKQMYVQSWYFFSSNVSEEARERELNDLVYTALVRYSARDLLRTLTVYGPSGTERSLFPFYIGSPSPPPPTLPSTVTTYRGGEEPRTFTYLPSQPNLQEQELEARAIAEMRTKLAGIVAGLSKFEVKELYVKRYVAQQLGPYGVEKQALTQGLRRLSPSELKGAIDDGTVDRSIERSLQGRRRDL